MKRNRNQEFGKLGNKSQQEKIKGQNYTQTTNQKKSSHTQQGESHTKSASGAKSDENKFEEATRKGQRASKHHNEESHTKSLSGDLKQDTGKRLAINSL